MCIRGFDNIEKMGMGIGIAADIVGCALIGVGSAIGIVHGWHSLAIGVIVTGGVVLISGVTGGLLVMKRAHYLEDKDKERLQKVSQLRRDVGNL